jgi:beta-glucanase (GH16 family)
MLNMLRSRMIRAAILSVAIGSLALHAAAQEKAPATTQASSPPQTIVSPLGKKMSLKFNDEFDAVPASDGVPYIDLKKWQTTFWQGSSERTLVPNGEAQYYMDRDYGGKNKIPIEQRPNPFSFPTPGILTISATRTPKELWGNYWMSEQRCFSSGLLISDKRFTFKYGYVEGRFKLPANRGAWPAFWLLPNDPSKPEPKNHPWPPEFDIFEGFGHRPTTFSTNLIAPKTEKTKVGQFMHDVGEDLSKDFHTWGFEWDENTAVWTFDGRELTRATITPAFRVPMYILVNLAVGGTWYSQEMQKAGTPAKPWEVDEASMPWKMECDYVRVYQVESAPTTAPGSDGKPAAN